MKATFTVTLDIQSPDQTTLDRVAEQIHEDLTESDHHVLSVTPSMKKVTLIQPTDSGFDTIP